MIPAQHDRLAASLERVFHQLSQPFARSGDLRKKFRVSWPGISHALGLRDRNIAKIQHVIPESAKLRATAGHANRGRAHIDAPSSLPQIQRRANNSHPLLLHEFTASTCTAFWETRSS